MTVSAAAPSLALLVHHIVLNVQVNAMAPPTHLLKQKLMAKALPDTGEPWTSLPNGIEYQPAANLSPLAQKHLRRLTEDEMSVGIFEKMFVDGAETYYDEYAQAWRALGFYIDCDYQGDGHRRELQEGEGSGCQRFMLWAAVRPTE